MNMLLLWSVLLVTVYSMIAVLPGVCAQGSMLELKTVKDASGMAKCIDGTSPTFYFREAPAQAHRNDWLIVLQGGGWCNNDVDCLARASTIVGSSKNLPNKIDANGIFSTDCSTGSIFCNYSIVYVNYCDGASFSGMRVDPLLVNSTKLYFRGRYNLMAVIDTLKQDYSLHNATHVALSGCSAGGAAAYLHGDFVGSLLPRSVASYGVIPGSGFFPAHNNVERFPLFATNIRYIFDTSNATYAMDESCLHDHAMGEEWRCFLAPTVYSRYLRSPNFIMNSVYDSYQTQCMLVTEQQDALEVWPSGMCSSIAAGWENCSRHDPYMECNTEQVEYLNDYHSYLLDLITQSKAFSDSRNGGFIHSCYTHADEFLPTYFTIASGGVSMSESVNRWWGALIDQTQTTKGNHHWYLPCTWKSGGGDARCNPSCPDPHKN